jgi:hypothetical protein
MVGATGAVIVRDDGKSVHWRDKCENCGNVSSVTHIVSSPGQGSRLLCGMYRCERCSHMSEIIIYG